MRFQSSIRHVSTTLGLLLVSLSLAQGQTIYSTQALGDLRLDSGAWSQGAGGIAIAMLDPVNVNLQNPAANAGVLLTRLQAGCRYEHFSTTTEQGDVASSKSNPDGFRLVIPMGKGWAVMTGLEPVTRVDFKIHEAATIGSATMTQKVSGSGGATQFVFGGARRFRDRFYVGAMAQYNFGRIKDEWEVDFDSGGYLDSRDKIETEFDGANFALGMIVKVNSYLDVGGTFQTPLSISTVRNTTFGFGGDDEPKSGKTVFPAAYGLGAVVRLGKVARVGADFHYQPWSKTEVDGSQAGNRFNDEQRISIGVESIPRLDSYARFHQRLVFRAGFYTRLLYTSDLAGNGIRESVATVGLGVPFYKGVGRVDLALEYGNRGTLPDNPAEETVTRLLLSVTGGEKWFVRRK